ncbi:hypothetical protein BDY21DRAFT_349483 [Lineolata rhizophorae]|uniref:Uncharacterized protein n=1 Tax=Lineolata rhizophorae TaxID=578093 RepID=A0A6A6NUM6_9PEZI|nr:hypothetical protein BDY21DRAFT_349483 [Lineolata rhizophorae]
MEGNNVQAERKARDVGGAAGSTSQTSNKSTEKPADLESQTTEDIKPEVEQRPQRPKRTIRDKLDDAFGAVLFAFGML